MAFRFFPFILFVLFASPLVGQGVEILSEGTTDTTETVLALLSPESKRPVLQFSEWTSGSPNSGMSVEYDGLLSGVDNKLHIRGVDALRKFTFTSGGRFGIGTQTPSEAFEIAGSGRMFIGDGEGANRTGLLIDAVENGDYARIHAYDYGTNSSMDLYFPSNVLIGTTEGAAGYKLSVDGKVMAEELRIEISSAWPDYVFDQDYDLMSLDDLEKSIKTNGHLPGMPNAAQVLENGIEVGAINRILVEKIEELTLHVIAQNKRIALLEEQLKANK